VFVLYFLNQYITLINQYTEFSQVLLHLYGDEKVFPESSFCIVLSYGNLKIVISKMLPLLVLDRKNDQPKEWKNIFFTQSRPYEFLGK